MFYSLMFYTFVIFGKIFCDLKKATSILLIFIFLLSSSGFSINTHYCKGKIKSINIVFSGNCKSCCGKKKMPKDCCKDKTENVKIKDNYIPSTNVMGSSAQFITFVLSYFQTFALSYSQNSSIEANLNYLYPPDKPVSLSILYRSILI